ncbi:YkvA family protein [Deinococcus navajonensis]|uniref:YkvA family protein n=1 Tax=Deinococcus navajonensis TaxID=309884 RepID=A0ABV8XPB8_9DEIO
MRLSRLRLVWHDALALLLALGDRRTPAQARLVAALGLLYAVMPLDLLPDLTPVLGIADDALIVPAVLALAARRLPAPVLQAARTRAARLPWLLPLGILGVVATGLLLWSVLARFTSA